MTNQEAPVKRQCSVHVPGDWDSHPCMKGATVERDDKWYCTIHDPEYMKAKNAERHATWLRESARRAELHNLQIARHRVTEGLTLDELSKVTPDLIRWAIKPISDAKLTVTELEALEEKWMDAMYKFTKLSGDKPPALTEVVAQAQIDKIIGKV